MDKMILDVCCGGRMFWFDKKDQRALFVDKRHEIRTMKDKTVKSGERTIEIAPDVVADFRHLPFSDGSFSLVVFDPPHLKTVGKGWMSAKYGALAPTWREDISAGFSECFRVLKTDGVLIFKWSEIQIPVKDILKLTPERPLFGHKSGKQSKTHWMAFIKDGTRSVNDR